MDIVTFTYEGWGGVGCSEGWDNIGDGGSGCVEGDSGLGISTETV